MIGPPSRYHASATLMSSQISERNRPPLVTESPAHQRGCKTYALCSRDRKAAPGRCRVRVCESRPKRVAYHASWRAPSADPPPPVSCHATAFSSSRVKSVGRILVASALLAACGRSGAPDADAARVPAATPTADGSVAARRAARQRQRPRRPRAHSRRPQRGGLGRDGQRLPVPLLQGVARRARSSNS